MTHDLDGGTETAAMILFDPESLPDDYDERTRGDAAAVVAEAAERGGLFLIDAGAGGLYDLRLMVGEGLPDDVATLVRPVGEVGRFRVAGGRLHFAGVEYGFRRDDSRLAKRPNMGSSCEVPPGTYRLQAYRMDDPEGFIEDRLRERTSPLALRLDAIMRRWLLPIGSLGAIAGVVGLVTLGWREWRVTALPVSLAMVLPAAVLSFTRTYRDAREARRRVAAECADYWAVMEPAEGG